MLTNESESSGVTGYKALQRLLKSYFDGEVLLIPLQQKEWMVLASQDLLAGGLADEKRIQQWRQTRICYPYSAWDCTS